MSPVLNNNWSKPVESEFESKLTDWLTLPFSTGSILDRRNFFVPRNEPGSFLDSEWPLYPVNPNRHPFAPIFPPSKPRLAGPLETSQVVCSTSLHPIRELLGLPSEPIEPTLSHTLHLTVLRHRSALDLDGSPKWISVEPKTSLASRSDLAKFKLSLRWHAKSIKTARTLSFTLCRKIVSLSTVGQQPKDGEKERLKLCENGWRAIRQFNVLIAPTSHSSEWCSRAVDILDGTVETSKLIPGIYRISTSISEDSQVGAQETYKELLFCVNFEAEGEPTEPCELHGSVISAALIRPTDIDSDLPVSFAKTRQSPFRLEWFKSTRARIEVLACDAIGLLTNAITCCPSIVNHDGESNNRLFVMIRRLHIVPCERHEEHDRLHSKPDVALFKIVVEVDIPSRSRGEVSIHLNFKLKNDLAEWRDWNVETSTFHLLPPVPLSTTFGPPREKSTQTVPVENPKHQNGSAKGQNKKFDPTKPSKPTIAAYVSLKKSSSAEKKAVVFSGLQPQVKPHKNPFAMLQHRKQKKRK